MGKYRNNHNEGRCLAIGLTPLFDAHCKCQYDDAHKQILNCHIIPSPYSSKFFKQKCWFKKPISISKLSTLPDAMSTHVCPVNWQILDQYELTQDIVNSVHVTRCELI